MTEIVPTEVFSVGQVSEVDDLPTIQCLKYACNLPFRDVLNVYKNYKFPGQMVVSISKKHLPLIQGQRPPHLPYKITDILPWFNGKAHNIPVVLPHHSDRQTGHVTVLNSQFLDFGDKNQMFDSCGPANVLIMSLDFGPHPELFVSA